MYSLDSRKAYDRVQWPFLMKVLQEMRIKEWFQTLKKIGTTTEKQHYESTFSVQHPSKYQKKSNRRTLLPYCPRTTNKLFRRDDRAQGLYGIGLSDTAKLPTGSFFADDSPLKAKSDLYAANLYSVVEEFCKEAGAKLHAQETEAIPMRSRASSTVSNGISILKGENKVTLLGIPTGISLTRCKQGLMNSMLRKCHDWVTRARTWPGRKAVAQAIILAALWYVISVLPINHKKDFLI